MRMLPTVLLCFWSCVVMAQSQPYEFSEVVYVKDSANKNLLFERAKTWIGKTFVSNVVIENENKNEGEILCKPIIIFKHSTIPNDPFRGKIRYSLFLYFKDGRYKYILKDFIHEGNKFGLGGGYDGGLITRENTTHYKSPIDTSKTQKAWEEIQETILKNANLLISSLKEGMNTQTEAEKKDW